MSKKPATKVSKNTDSKKNAKTTKEPIVIKLPTTNKKSKDIQSQITMLRKLSVVVYVLLAGAAAFMMSGAGQQLRWTYQTRDALASQTNTVFAGASRFLIDMPYRVVLIAVLLLATLFSVLALTKLKAAYTRAVDAKVVGYRWVAIGVTAALMMSILGAVNGVQDVLLLKLMAGSVLVTALVSWIAERDAKVAGRPVWTAFGVSVISGIVPWLYIAGILIGTALYGGVRLPWYVYALDGVALAGFIAIAVNLFLSIKGYKQWANYVAVERNYTAISFVLKTAFAAVLIFAFMR